MAGAAPILLLSMPQMADPNFARTVVLLCDYTAGGAFGLVVNRQMEEPVWTLVKTEPPIRVDPNVKLWIGVPVDQHSAWGLVSSTHVTAQEHREFFPLDHVTGTQVSTH